MGNTSYDSKPRSEKARSRPRYNKKITAIYSCGHSVYAGHDGWLLDSKYCCPYCHEYSRARLVSE